MSDVSQRLSKFLSNSGVASRRNAEEIIKSGRVFVNNINILEPQYHVNPNYDIITVDNKVITSVKRHDYIALYKPVGYISDLKDPAGRKLARDLIKTKTNIYPVGRLDYSSEGLIIFTNDGDVANFVMHPKFEVEKEYHVKFKGRLDEGDFLKLKNGLLIDGVSCRIKAIKFLKSSIKNNWYRIIISEGRNRIIRKIGEQIGHQVLKLKRVRIGNIKLGDLEPGQYRSLTDGEIRPFKMRSD
ncbi:MAG: pseudouridine synthase [Proteobacteria bacterium]|nr:pseudouridine synthase [Pseudomonadota bacterium]